MRAGLSAAGFPGKAKPIRRCVTVSVAQIEGREGRYPDAYRLVFRCVGSCRIIEPGELALRIVTDFTDDERMLPLPQQQEIIGIHPHDFIGRRQSAGRDVAAGAFRTGTVAEDARRA
jgi:hypothetical protein